jgi:hypothetical protein
MINISVQESEAFDRLSILEVKKINSSPLQQQTIQKQIQELQEIISKGIGSIRAMQIYRSPEYKHLLEINSKLFLYVEKAKKNEVTAKQVDDEVYNRHLAKKNIQKVFFNNEMNEIKIGYGK